MLLIFIFFLSIILSLTTTIPFFIAVFAVCTAIFKKSWVFFIALIFGLFLDLINLRFLGLSSLFLAVFIFISLLYERKFETQTATFVFLISFLGSVVYLIIFGYDNVLIQAFITSTVAILLFKILNKFSNMDQNS